MSQIMQSIPLEPPTTAIVWGRIARTSIAATELSADLSRILREQKFSKSALAPLDRNVGAFDIGDGRVVFGSVAARAPLVYADFARTPVSRLQRRRFDVDSVPESFGREDLALDFALDELISLRGLVLEPHGVVAARAAWLSAPDGDDDDDGDEPAAYLVGGGTLILGHLLESDGAAYSSAGGATVEPQDPRRHVITIRTKLDDDVARVVGVAIARSTGAAVRIGAGVNRAWTNVAKLAIATELERPTGPELWLVSG